MVEEKRELTEREREVGEAALGTLVNQFANPYDFVRELVQNSLDSGTPVVEIWTNYQVANDRRGVCEIHVHDYGTGMDEMIIDTKLTCLFSSSKEDDLTNIGKFGIGFVSVFAIKPGGVLIKTARGGEHWEVFFLEDRTFEKTRIDEPFEGTHITVFKEMPHTGYKDAVNQVFSTLEFWCKHAEKRIMFWNEHGDDAVDSKDGTKRRRRRRKKIEVNKSMETGGFMPMRVNKGDTEIALAFSDDHFYGFYNQGLTLAETNASEVIAGYEEFFGHVSFKLKSPYLEHTLTRDTIRRDGNFHKAMGLVVDAARTELVQSLVDELERLATKPELDTTDRKQYFEALKWLYLLPRALDPTFGFGERMADFSDNFARAALFWKKDRELGEKSVDASKRKLFRCCYGDAYTLAEIDGMIEATDNVVVLTTREGSRTRELVESGRPVFLSPANSHAKCFFKTHIPRTSRTKEEHGALALLDWLGGRSYPFSAYSKNEIAGPQRNFLERLGTRLGDVDFPLKRLQPVNFLGDDPRSSELAGVVSEKEVAVTQPSIQPKDGAKVIAINIDGEAFAHLSTLFETTPDFALTLGARRVILETVAQEEFREDLLDALWGGPR
ncbi:MAG: hypothetical protein GY854_03555 [Deltaproteobacteria bacterium]|nr:hypothetical protein [Deltaproteobacteria bacterium]